jgi:hypothetical protein
VIIYSIESYQVAMDECLKWVGLPYWQGRPGLEATKELIPQSPFAANPLIPEMGPSAQWHSYAKIAETQRRMAMMEIVEGLRAYAAAHDGNLPPTLDDIAETPAPRDPMTGRAFAYHVDGATATLHSEATTDRGSSPMTFHIHMLPGKK